jgi:hypothetical protein
MNRTLVARHVELLEVARDRWRAFHGALGSKSGLECHASLFLLSLHNVVIGST